jgi:hypothetical protein
MKKDIKLVSDFYGLSEESSAMAYTAAKYSDRAKTIYKMIRVSIEKEKQ